MTESIDYLLVGPITADIVSNRRILGGTVSYAAPLAQGFGHRVGIVTSAAKDEPLLHKLSQYAHIALHEADHTTTMENVYTDHGRVQYVHSVASPITINDIPTEWLTSKLVHLAPLVNLVDPKIVHHFSESIVMFTPQGWMRRWGEDGKVYFKHWLNLEVLQVVDLVIFSRQDIKEAPEIEREFASIVKHLIITDGENGGAYYHKNKAMSYPAVQVEEIEPTGAGDVFATSLLASLPALQHDMNNAIRVAAKVAALSVTQVGVSFITSEIIQNILHQTLSLDTCHD